MNSTDPMPQPDDTDTPDTTQIDALVGDWLSVPAVAELLGTAVTSVRSALSDRRIIGMKRGERRIFSVPACFLVPKHLSNPANVKPVAVQEGAQEQIIILPALQGTIIMLSDSALTDTEIIEWLFSEEAMLGQTPVAALLAGRKSAVRRAAQAVA
ncbi:Rv2175c family DNA-binding protein [Sanguibacter antarcticus]|uniref:Rv2175c family DNA-binding protein n=1 Tax=Sanguibacter antarcticus TaxID=372484 RepID=UPI001FE3398B|nr:Rv2175c family DNA-binding protein [Sanguibacter antarcticus]